MSAAKVNPFLANARCLKVDALVDVLRVAHITADLALEMDDEDWRAAAIKAKCKPPGGDETKNDVLTALRNLERQDGK